MLVQRPAHLSFHEKGGYFIGGKDAEPYARGNARDPDDRVSYSFDSAPEGSREDDDAYASVYRPPFSKHTGILPHSVPQDNPGPYICCGVQKSVCALCFKAQKNVRNLCGAISLYFSVCKGLTDF